jgi:4-alpha-glucanotransferase
MNIEPRLRHMNTVNWRRWGIEPGYRSAQGKWIRADEASLRLVQRAMQRPRSGARAYADVWVIDQGETRPIVEPSLLRLEDGTTRPAGGYLARDLPIGYHELESLETGDRTRLIVTPGQCYLPDGLRTWGWAVQLYALRSKRSWGMGDLGDLRVLARWSARELGAGMLLLNPLHAPMPTLPQQASPYYPSSRLFRNPLYLRIEDVPGAAESREVLASFAAAGATLADASRIDRDAIFALKLSALEKLFARFRGSRSFDAYRAEQGQLLRRYAVFCVLAERYGNDWRKWPRGYRHPDRPELARFAHARRSRVAFHEWLQWLLDVQLGRAGKELPLVGDLAVGVDPGGADGWLWQDLFAEGMEVGAPPDEFNTQGQKWGLLPLDPGMLRSAGYEPFVRIVRSAMRHMGGVRLDHVMGLFRLFWIPLGKKPKQGVYVRYPALDLLGIAALESVRAKAYFIGEDLGTVEAEVRRELAYRKTLSYRVLWFESGRPESYPQQAVSTVTTHDLPTIAGLWSGSDLVTQRKLELVPNEKGTRALRRSLARLIRAGKDASIDEVVQKTYAALARAPSALVTATLDDALAVQDRPNMPGTIDEYPCWCIPLPRKLEEIMKDPRPRRIARALRTR